MEANAARKRTWRSDTLLLAAFNAAGYIWGYWDAGWIAPHLATYICGFGAIISLVPAAREISNPRFRRAALVGLGLSCAVLMHIFGTPCIGPCK